MVFEQERRYSPRIQFKRHAKLSFDSGGSQECCIHNLSLTGMFIDGDFQQNEGDSCAVNFIHKGTYTCLNFDASAHVKRKVDNGVAIEFTSIPLDSLMLLQMILFCKNKEDFLNRGIKSIDNLPFKVPAYFPS